MPPPRDRAAGEQRLLSKSFPRGMAGALRDWLGAEAVLFALRTLQGCMGATAAIQRALKQAEEREA